MRRKKRVSFTVEKTSAQRELPLLNCKHVRSWLLNPDPQHCPTKASLYARNVEATMVSWMTLRTPVYKDSKAWNTQVGGSWITDGRSRQGPGSAVWKIILFWRNIWGRSSVPGPWEMGGRGGIGDAGMCQTGRHQIPRWTYMLYSTDNKEASVAFKQECAFLNTCIKMMGLVALWNKKCSRNRL